MFMVSLTKQFEKKRVDVNRVSSQVRNIFYNLIETCWHVNIYYEYRIQDLKTNKCIFYYSEANR